MDVAQLGVRFAEEVEGLEDDEPGDDGVGRGDGRDDVAGHFWLFWVFNRVRGLECVTAYL